MGTTGGVLVRVRGSRPALSEKIIKIEIIWPYRRGPVVLRPNER
jgi:hypothetical protein